VQSYRDGRPFQNRMTELNPRITVLLAAENIRYATCRKLS
jgi:hypothetical protein